MKVNSTGGIDPNFLPAVAFNNRIQDVLVQDDSKLVLVGHFFETPGIPGSTNRIIRLNSDGTIDTTFGIGTGLGGNADCIIKLSDGSLLIGGSFTTFSTAAFANGIVSVLNNGMENTAVHNFGFGFYTGFSNQNVLRIRELSDSRLVVLGRFHSFGNSAAFNTPNVARLIRTQLNVDEFSNKPQVKFAYSNIDNAFRVEQGANHLMKIFAITGELVYEARITSDYFRASIDKLSKGIYIAQISKVQGNHQNFKFVKN